VDDRKKINEWARKNNYRHLVVVMPLPSGERFGFNLFVRNIALDKDIKLGMEDDLKKALAKAEEYRAFFGCPVKLEGTEAKTSEMRKEAKEKKK
jgi:hypothetical protein